YLLGYRQRDVLIDPERAKAIYNGGWINPTVCVDGRLIGVWRHRASGGSVSVEVSPDERPTRAVLAGLGREAEAIGGFLGAGASLHVAPVSDRAAAGTL
ncbi:MAG: winged helix DNA-binding domain-containing protein, partial [Candidatus Dormibacteraeota bacterium]|nr:winged helix DNA-binding domain-containing protein [Candidatus Dormibacteraeota bacterium]